MATGLRGHQGDYLDQQLRQSWPVGEITFQYITKLPSAASSARDQERA